MLDEQVVCFWSYASDDDRLDDGNILTLASLVQEEYALITGESLTVFVDRKAIAWGEKWRERVDSSFAQTTFLIPIITPRYFSRPECRRELLAFAGKTVTLGLEKQLLPILYVDVPSLAPENPDEAVALVALAQYVDWRSFRLMEPESREYSKGRPFSGPPPVRNCSE